MLSTKQKIVRKFPICLIIGAYNEAHVLQIVPHTTFRLKSRNGHAFCCTLSAIWNDISLCVKTALRLIATLKLNLIVLYLCNVLVVLSYDKHLLTLCLEQPWAG